MKPSLVPSETKTVYTVSALNQRVRELLEVHLPLLWVEGEITNLAQPSSGHWYFTLKDAKAQVRCAMFRNRNALVKQAPKTGDKVLLRARVGLYEGRGDYQLIVEHMEAAGFGALQRQFEQLKAKLSDEGLFAEKHKQPLPSLVQHIGVITSPTGAAIRDIIAVAKRRFPATTLSLFPAPVQGQGAAEAMVKAIQLANQCDALDVLIVGRGGGSLEDLWAFNEEILARAIFASNIPIISAVGHEVDFTIADFVADLRAATPSAAIEILLPHQEEIQTKFSTLQQSLHIKIQQILDQQTTHLGHLHKRLRHPGDRIKAQGQSLDHLEIRLQSKIKQALATQISRYKALQQRLVANQPIGQVKHYEEQLRQLFHQLHRTTAHHQRQQQQRLVKSVELLDALNPLQTLKRGYAIIENKTHNIIHNTEQVTVNEKITAKLAVGTLTCLIEEINQ